MDMLVPPRWTDLLEGVREVILVPHGLLHELPLHALPLSAASGRTLTDLGPVRHLPGLVLAHRLRERRPAGAAAAVFAYPSGTLPRTEFEAEARAVATALGAALILGADATRERFTEVAPGSSVVHVATHGSFDPGDPLGSGLALHDGVLSARDVIRRIRLAGSVVVLSGCETSRRAVDPLDESEGLVRAFLVAGASAVVASQWKVDSASARRIMEAMYRGHDDLAVALRQAMLEERAGPAFGHPFYWAPFVVWGGGRTRA
jgi:CHAT domain-containing protein